MAASSTISSKGQVTVPVEIRNRLGLRPGDRVAFCVENGLTVLRPVRPEGNVFEKYIGAAPAFSSIEEINAWVRDMRDDEYEAEETRKRREAKAHEG
jgi:antitoxin PrlF